MLNNSKSIALLRNGGFIRQSAKYVIWGMLGWLAVGAAIAGTFAFKSFSTQPSDRYRVNAAEALALAVHLSVGLLLIQDGKEQINPAYDARDLIVTCNGERQKKGSCLMLPIFEQYDADCGMFTQTKWPRDCIHLPASDIYLNDPVAREKMREALLQPCRILQNAGKEDAPSRNYIALHMQFLGCDNDGRKPRSYGLVTFSGIDKNNPGNLHYFFEAQ